MASEKISIEVVDKINASIAKKLEKIAKNAGYADSEITELSKSIAGNKNASLKLLQAQNSLEGQQLRLKKAQSDLDLMTKKGTASKHKLLAAENRLEAAALRVRAANSKLTTVVQKESVAAAKLTASTNKLTAAQTKAGRSTRALNTDLGSMLRTGLAIAGTGFGVREIVGLGNAYTMLQNKLRNVTDTSLQLANVTERVFDIANRTRTPVQETAQAFQRFDRALIQLGASQEESLRLTETVNKQLVVSGAASSEQASALLQLSQAFNKGKLDGDEFRSVMELMPPVADAIAKQLKVTRGELLNLAPDGKITAEVMRAALANAAEDVDKKFAKMIPTIGQSFSVLRNKATEFFGVMDSKYGITSKMSAALLAMANNMDVLAIAGATLGATLLIAFGPKLILAIKALGVAIAANPFGAMAVAVVAITGTLYKFRNEIKLSKDGLTTLGDVAGGVWDFMAEAAGKTYEYIAKVANWSAGEQKKEIEQTSIYFNDSLEVNAQNLSVFDRFVQGVFGAIGGVVKKVVNSTVRFWYSGYTIITELWKDFPKTMNGLFSAFVNFALGKVEGLVNGIIGAINGMLDYLNKANAILRDYGFETFGRDIGKIEFRLDLAGFKSDASDIENKLKKIAETDYGGIAADYVLEKVHARTMERLAAPEAPTATLRPAGAPPTVAASLAGASGAAKKTKKKKVGKLPELGNAEYQKILDETAGAMMHIHEAAAATDFALNNGLITLENYKNRMTDLRVELADLKMEMGTADFADVMVGALDRVRDGFVNVATSMSENFGNLFKTLSDGFADSLGRAIVYGDDLGESLKNVAKSAMSELISSIIKMGIQWAVTQALQTTATVGAMTAQTAAAAAAGSAMASAWATPAALASLASFGGNAAPATAGIASTTGFANAMARMPGFEDGGYTGNTDRSDIAGVVHGGEFVMNADSVNRIGVSNLESMQAGTAMAPAAQQAPEVTIINATDPEMMVDAMNSDSGTEAVWNIISSNPERLRAMV